MPGTICQNGGTCTINGAGYLCNCPIGFTGMNCHTQEIITTCNSNPCGTHGTCIQAVLPSGPAIFCNCENRWTGKYCDVSLVDENCPVGFCLSGGTCRMNGNIPYCQCPSAYTGQRCEEFVGTLPTTTTTTPTNTTSGSTLKPLPGGCLPNPCLNGGACFNTGNDFICLCKQQWSGPTCNVASSVTTTVATTSSSTNACFPNPCEHGGVCYKHGASYVCVCTSQYAGPTCASPKATTIPTVTPPSSAITCANQPCQNGGVCYNAGPSYFCYCGTNSIHTGQNCETPIAAITADCPLNCAPGYCVRSGGMQETHACMCNGTLTPTRCPST